MSSDKTRTITWKPIVAGVLELVSGIAWIIGAFVFALLLISRTFYLGDMEDPSTMTRFWIATILLLVPGLLALIGGGAALNRRNPTISIVGAACSAPMLLGIVALVLLSQSRTEFAQSKTKP
jgi:ABC-type branched-subunit amino acid transport system permease subunit